MDDVNQRQASPHAQPPPSSQPPPINPEPSPYNYGKRGWIKWGLIYLAIAIIIYGGIYYFFLSKQGLKPYSNAYPTIASSPTPTLYETGNWKTYASNKIMFKYPPNFIVEEREKDFFVIVPKGVTPAPQQGISIDTRFLDKNTDYLKAIEKTQKELINSKRQEIDGGVKISGTLGPGFGEGLLATTAILSYGPGHGNIAVTVGSADLTVGLSTFDQIVSSVEPIIQEISWEEAKRLLQSCQVKGLFQAHSKYVEFILFDSTLKSTTESRLDEVMSLAEQASLNCGFYIPTAIE
ncbi:MAG: hypothetical protein HYS68_02000 [Candidatus Levybacteria bacterium]|nr:hypothetical protein [Candidatus Levybacteria bacterium]